MGLARWQPADRHSDAVFRSILHCKSNMYWEVVSSAPVSSDRNLDEVYKLRGSNIGSLCLS
jgi:hypothetical protein